ncbi:MAG: hypothetical protein IKU09_08680 [Firmicutes bacterium]|nr:hypothetical protein [Bacillota bacterium]
MKAKLQIGLSKALIKENYKMYWYLPALSFIAYFMAGIFPLIMNPHYLTDPNHWYLEDCLMNWNVVFVFLLIAAPLVGSIVMMHYLHSPNYAIAIHAQPFSRGKIFWSQTLTGWSMCILPPAAMTLIYLIITGQPGHSLLYGATSVSVITFFYGIFILAGVLAGTAVMHVLLCGIFFGILPLVIWLTWFYCENFLAGFYDMPDWMADFLFDTNPILSMIEDGGEWFGPGHLLTYLMIGLAFLLLSALLYSRAKLEHVGDSMLFRAAEEIITWLVVFVGMSAFGFFFYAVMDTKAAALIGMAVGTLLAFVIVKIVIARTFRFGIRQNLRSLGAFTLIAVIFAGCTMYDLTGFTHRVPEAEDVVSVERVNLGYGDTFSYWYNYIDDDILREQETLTSPQAIEKVTALHRYIVENNLYDDDFAVTGQGAVVYDSYGNEVYAGNTYLTFRYTMKDGSKMSRRFGFRLNQEAADLINAVITDAEYKADGALPDIFTPENISSIELSVYDYSYEYAENFQSGEMTDQEIDTAQRTAQAKLILTDPEEIETFLRAMNQDHYSHSYTVKANGTVNLTETVTADSKVVPAPEFRAMDYMDISGYIYLHPGTEGVQEEWNGTAPDKNSKPIGSANFTVHSGHQETLTFIESRLRTDGYTSHADHIAESLR